MNPNSWRAAHASSATQDGTDVDMSVESIMEATGLDERTATLFFSAMSEGQEAFNAAKRLDAQEVMISRKTLFRLLAGTAVLLGLVNMADGGAPVDPVAEA